MPQRLLDKDGNPDGFFAIVVDLGAVFTARQVGPPQGLDIRSTLQRISTELQSISYAATTSMLTALPLNRPELTGLTSREVEVLSILLGGDRVPVIAERLHISQNTVRNHLKSMYRKLGVGSQTELINLIRSYADDADAMRGFEALAELEGILAALESSHAIGWVLRERESLAGRCVLVNLSGRGDKDLDTIAALREERGR